MKRTNILRFDLDHKEALGRRLQPDATIVQEDRNLVMAGAGVLDLDSGDSLDAAYLAMAEHRPLPLGRFLLQRSRGGEADWTYQAVVHDLDCRPTCRSGDVRRSLSAILKDSVKRGMSFVGVEPLGLWGGRGLTEIEMVAAFESAIFELSVDLVSPFRATLLLDSIDVLEEFSHLFRSRLLSKGSRNFRTVDDETALVEVRQRGNRLHCRFVPGTLSGYVVTSVDEGN